MAGDLNLKKSWNPALVKNQSKVWEDEQAKLAELKKIREIDSELKKEQEYKRLLQLQHGDEFNQKDLNKGEKLKLNKLNWMYEDMPFEEPSETAKAGGFIEHDSEFLQGKEQAENLLQGKKSFKREQGPGDNISRILSVGKSVAAPTNRKDDPLLMIKKQRIQAVRGNDRAHNEKAPEKDATRPRESHSTSRHHRSESLRHKSESRTHHSSKIRSGSSRPSGRSREHKESSSRHRSGENRLKGSGESRKREHSSRESDESRSSKIPKVESLHY